MKEATDQGARDNRSFATCFSPSLMMSFYQQEYPLMSVHAFQNQCFKTPFWHVVGDFVVRPRIATTLTILRRFRSTPRMRS